MLTILCWPPPPRVAHLVVFNVSIHLCRSRSEKLKRYLQRSTLTNSLFKILKFSGPSLLGMTLSTLQPHFLSGGLWQMMIVVSFPTGLSHPSISIHLCRSRSEKLKRYLQRSTLTNSLFKILKFSGPSLLGMTLSTLQPHFLSGGLWQMMIVVSFPTGLSHPSISIHLCRSRSEKLKRYLQRSTLTNSLFKILKFSGPSLLGMTLSTLQPHFLSGGLWQMMIVVSFPIGLSDPSSSRPYQSKK